LIWPRNDRARSLRANPIARDAWQAALDFGIDLSQTEYLLTVTPAERLERHEQALALVRAMREAGKRYYGLDARDPDDLKEQAAQ
jgi:hypothetical protein